MSWKGFKAIDPIEFKNVLWPNRKFYDKQEDIVYSVEECPETFVQAGNMLGKDYTAGFIALSYFLRYPIVRVVTSSVKDDHLRVLWGEIDGWIKECKFPLERKFHGPLFINHRDIKKVGINTQNTQKCAISYMIGTVSEKGEGMAGHHAPFTLAILDEGSGIDDEVYKQIQGWAKRILVIGNPNPCTNFFYKACKRGNVLKDA